MIEKLEKVLDLLAEALTIYIRKNGAQVELSIAAPAQEQAAPAKPTRARKPKGEKAAEAPAASPFTGEPQQGKDAPLDNTPADKPSVEDVTEAKARSLDLGGMYIRRHIKSVPPGLERYKALVEKTCGRSITALEQLTHEDHVKLIPALEKALDEKVAA